MTKGTMTQHGYSKIQDFESCPHKYYLRWEMGLRPKRVNLNLLAGTIFHAARHAWLLANKDEVAGIGAISDAFIDIGDTLGEEEKEEFTSYCVRMFLDYAKHYKDDNLERTGLEIDFETEIGGHPFTGRLDGIVVVDKQVFVEEVKTTSVSIPQFIQEMHMDGKTTGYVWAAQKITGRLVEGVWLDIIYKKRDKAQTFEFGRGITLRSADQLQQWERATISKLDNIKRCREEGYWPHNYGHCHGRYGKCPFLDLCKYGERPELIEAQFTTDTPVEGGEQENGA